MCQHWAVSEGIKVLLCFADILLVIEVPPVHVVQKLHEAGILVMNMVLVHSPRIAAVGTMADLDVH